MEDFLSLLHEYLLPFIVTLSIVVFVHEFGHYWVARRCGVRILEFSIGFGPEIWGFRAKKSGVRWKLSALPLGGYVRMFGDADPASTPDKAVHTMTAAEKKVAYYHQNVWKRMAIAVAGPAANFGFALVVMTVLFMTWGEPYSPPVAEMVTPNTAAAAAGMKPGDRVLSMDGQAIEKFSDMQKILVMNTGTPIVLEILREGDKLTMTVTPRMTDVVDRFGMHHQIARLGIAAAAAMEYRHYGFIKALATSVTEVWEVSRDTLVAVKQIVLGVRSTEELGGPIRIAKITGDIVKEKSLPDYIWFLVVISLNLGLVNLFPIPLLDGGHLMLYAIEAVRGKPLSERVQEYVARVGIITVLTLLVLTTWNDLVQNHILAYFERLFF